MPGDPPPAGALARTSASLRRLLAYIEPLGLWPKFKQLVAFFQVLLSLGSVYRTNLPTQFYNLDDLTPDLFVEVVPRDYHLAQISR